MKKVMVIGCPGSGKSTFSRALHEKTGTPLFHLDRMYWNSDRSAVEKSVFLQRLSDVLKKREWILDGNYNATLELRLEFCDTVVFLDYPTEICLNGVRERRGKARSDMPWIEAEGEVDAEFIRFIENFAVESRPKILDLLKKYPEKNVFILKNRKEAELFLESVSPISTGPI